MRSSDAAGNRCWTSTTRAFVTGVSVKYRCRKMASTSSTRDRDALPKTFSRCKRCMFSCTDTPTSQWESSVFVSASNAPALIIFDVYGARASRSFVHLMSIVRLAMHHPPAPAHFPRRHDEAGLSSEYSPSWGVNAIDRQRQQSYVVKERSASRKLQYHEVYREAVSPTRREPHQPTGFGDDRWCRSH